MIKRALEKELKTTAQQFPVIAVLGPRQSGKTTLVKNTFKKHNYITLEDLDKQRIAQADPRGFLEANKTEDGLIIDEVQYVPELFSYIKTFVDEHKGTGQFILTGSQNFLLNEKISQSLAGRVAILTLLPLSIDELKRASLLPKKVESIMFFGGYPRIFDEKISPIKWYPNYIRTYIERDVRNLKNIENLSRFQHFIALCAGRIGQVLNLASLGDDCGITSNTVAAWLSLLECSYIIFRLQPHYENFRKRLIKSPKLYFYDTGLACSLLEITSEGQLSTHYMRGNLFESFVFAELMKNQFNKDRRPKVYFWRDSQGHEIDGVIEQGMELMPLEIKAGKTINTSFFDSLNYWNNLSGLDPKKSFLIYGGNEKQIYKGINILGWQDLHKVFEKD
jgi:predicted AAA+ superfamily ATPase